MEFIKIPLLALFSLIVLFILTKLSGNKQISELTMFDHVISISIGSIAAEMASDLENFMEPLLAMLVYGLASFIISVLSSKSIAVRRVIFGKTMLIFSHGRFSKRNMKKSRIDLNEFLMQCRTAGYFDLNDLDYIFLEPSGKLSFLPKPNKQPITADYMKLVPNANPLVATIIIDGDIMHKNLAAMGRDRRWLMIELKTLGIKSPAEVFLATLDTSGKLSVFQNTDFSPHLFFDKKANDLFE